MNTHLEVNSNFNVSPFSQKFGTDQFYELFNLLQARARDKKQGLSASEHILYNIVRGHELNRGFTPVTNKVKLANGMLADYGFLHAKVMLDFALKRGSLKTMLKLTDEMNEFLLIECK